MSRLDELVQMRARLDAEIEKERRSLWAVAHLRDEVEELLEHQPIETAEILRAVATESDVSVADIIGRSRDAKVVDARHIAAWLLCEQGMSLPAVGRTLHRDHTTVLHSRRRVSGSTTLGTRADSLRSSLGSRLEVAS